MGTRSHAKKRCGNAIPTRSHPTTPLPVIIVILLVFFMMLVDFCKGHFKYNCKVLVGHVFLMSKIFSDSYSKVL